MKQCLCHKNNANNGPQSKNCLCAKDSNSVGCLCHPDNSQHGPQSERCLCHADHEVHGPRSLACCNATTSLGPHHKKCVCHVQNQTDGPESLNCCKKTYGQGNKLCCEGSGKTCCLSQAQASTESIKTNHIYNLLGLTASTDMNVKRKAIEDDFFAFRLDDFQDDHVCICARDPGSRECCKAKHDQTKEPMTKACCKAVYGSENAVECCNHPTRSKEYCAISPTCCECKKDRYGETSNEYTCCKNPKLCQKIVIDFKFECEIPRTQGGGGNFRPGYGGQWGEVLSVFQKAFDPSTDWGWKVSVKLKSKDLSLKSKTRWMEVFVPGFRHGFPSQTHYKDENNNKNYYFRFSKQEDLTKGWQALRSQNASSNIFEIKVAHIPTETRDLISNNKIMSVEPWINPAGTEINKCSYDPETRKKLCGNRGFKANRVSVQRISKGIKLTLHQKVNYYRSNSKHFRFNTKYSQNVNGKRCYIYYSPLMVFFDKKRPHFKNVSDFITKDSYTYWPEKNHPGYFLAFDRDKDQKITSSHELFRNSIQFTNGFENLKQLDSNKDLVIDSKDKNFSQLYLWKDRNGNAKGETRELISLKSMNIQSISLKYKGRIKHYGHRAKEVQGSFLTFKNKKGDLKKAKVIDIWFSPSPSARQIASHKEAEERRKKEKNKEPIKRFKAL